MGRETNRRVKFEKGILLSLAQERPEKGEVVWYDTVQPGLALRIPAKGEPRFAFYGWVNGGPKRRNWEPLRAANGVTVPEARKWAADAKTALAAGREPGAKADAPEPATTEPTLRVVFARYIREVRATKATWREDVLRFRKHVKAEARLPISAVDAEWLKTLHRRVSGKGTRGAADKVVSLLSAVLSFHLPHGAHNPASEVRRNGSEARNRRLSDEDYRRIEEALATIEAEPITVPGGDGADPANWPEYRKPKNNPAKLEALREEWRTRLEARREEAREVRRTALDVIRVAMGSGARAANVCAMEWTELDLEAGVWCIPSAKAKAGEPIEAVLMPEAVDVLKRRRAAMPMDSRFVFPAGNAKSKSEHFVNYHTAWNRVKELAGIDKHAEGTWFHDLRGNFAKRLSAAGANAFTIRDQLGHAKIETTLRYVGSGDLNTKRDAVRRASEQLREAMSKRGSEGAK